MRKSFIPVETEVGYIKLKSSALSLTSFNLINNEFILKGKIDSDCCDKQIKDVKWYDYQLTMKDVEKCDAITVEEYQKMNFNLESALTEIVDNYEMEEGKKMLIAVTHDWAFLVTCKDYEFNIDLY